MAFLSKSGLALATGLTLPLLGLFGYQPGTALTAQLGFLLSLTYAGVPCLIKLCALLCLIAFEKDLTQEKPAG